MSDGFATTSLERISGVVEDEGGMARSFSVVRKEARPLGTGQHASDTDDPTHWTYWRREPPSNDAGGYRTVTLTSSGSTGQPARNAAS